MFKYDLFIIITTDVTQIWEKVQFYDKNYNFNNLNLYYLKKVKEKSCQPYFNKLIL